MTRRKSNRKRPRKPEDPHEDEGMSSPSELLLLILVGVFFITLNTYRQQGVAKFWRRLAVCRY